MIVPFLPAIQQRLPDLQSRPANQAACARSVRVQERPPFVVLSTVPLPVVAGQLPPPTTKPVLRSVKWMSRRKLPGPSYSFSHPPTTVTGVGVNVAVAVDVGVCVGVSVKVGVAVGVFVAVGVAVASRRTAKLSDVTVSAVTVTGAGLAGAINSLSAGIVISTFHSPGATV